TVWPGTFHTGKIDSEFGRKSPRDRRSFYARFFAFLDLRRSLRSFSWQFLFRFWRSRFFLFFLFGLRLFCFPFWLLLLFFLSFSSRRRAFPQSSCRSSSASGFRACGR